MLVMSNMQDLQQQTQDLLTCPFTTHSMPNIHS